ncbi:MAG: tetratricopeptide repeat protein [Myxococcales bacterium]|nr:tetratricopeptide repeat protein [Myxococcales bacterium]MCB9575555.1 tetratricopeptide repeat protein [Polyangiaceae bacterium]
MERSWEDPASPLHGAYHAMVNQDFSDARGELEGIVAREPTADALYLLSTVLAAAGDWDASLARADEGIALDATHTDCRFNRGAALDQLGRLEDAVSTYRAALEVDPTHTNVALNLVLLLRRLTRHEDALQVGATCLEHMPRARMLRYKQAESLAILGRSADARLELERVIRDDPNAIQAARQNPFFSKFADQREWKKTLMLEE